MAVDLDGAVACVTGGARGIGRATAAALADRGTTVWIGDVDADAAEQAAAELGVHAAHLDVTDRDSFAVFLDEAGEVDVLVNNAGVMRTGAFVEQGPDTQDREIAINLGGVVTGMRLVLPGMLERGRGHIVNVASMAGKMTVPGASVYTATKFAVAALSRTVRAELAGTPVTVATVLPSAVATDLDAGLNHGPIPVSPPSDVADAIVASCRGGRREIYVPRWAGPVGRFVDGLPEPVGELAKRAAGAQGRLTVDNEQRRAYAARP